MDHGIYIRAADDKWNDFGYQSLFDFAIFEGDQPFWRRFRLGFLDIDESPYDLVRNQFNHDGDILSAERVPDFFSMQIDEDKYRDLLRDYGPDKTSMYLLRLGDVVALRAFSPKAKILEQAESSNIFALSLIRTDEAFNAYRNGHLILLGKEVRKFASAPSEIEIPAFRVGEWADELKIRLNFKQAGIFPKRIAVLIGPNGSGKSLSLRKICECYLDKFTRAFLPRIEKLIAVCIPSSSDGTFPRPQLDEIFYVRVTSLGAELPDQHSISLSEAVYNLARDQWSNDESQSIRWRIFQRAVAEMLPFSSLALVPQAVLNGGSIVRPEQVISFKNLMSGGELGLKSMWTRAGEDRVLALQHDLKYVPISSGQASFVRLAAQLAHNVIEGSLVLIDEPETHLHPKYISQFMSVLDSILGSTKSVAVIATHSPYIVREVSRDQVHILHVNSSKKIEVFRPRLKTFGADIGLISASVFGDDLGTESADRIVDYLIANLEMYQDWERELYSELSTETTMYIRRKLREYGERLL